ncbi:MAG: hypothetical protein COB02_01185 [Candidatus Cloacimonadota bacterium]|nr:MAG: hypothetical protein COB02_01185 [Candidatus Cloacimonadota bacterium]
MTESKKTPILEIKNLRKFFPVYKGIFSKHVADVRAVDNVSFILNEGETLGLVGESGCGKTTVGRSISRLLEPTSGEVLFQGVDIIKLSSRDLRRVRRDLQIIFQDPYSSLNPRKTVSDLIGEALLFHGMVNTEEEKDERVRELLVKVGLSASYLNRYPHEFSGGQRQRIGIARAIALNPKLIICDESVSALDVSVQAQVLNLLMDLKDEMGLSYIFIAHDLSVVKHISDKIAVMYLGQIVEFGYTKDIFKNPKHPYTKALLSALPKPDPKSKSKRILLQGDVPTPINPPPGCYFSTRCPEVLPICTEIPSPMKWVSSSHHCKCHLVNDRREINFGFPDKGEKERREEQEKLSTEEQNRLKQEKEAKEKNG